MTTVSDPQQRDTVLDLIPGNLRRGVKPVGRLDVQTEGLLLLTDDGDLARRVTHPSVGCPKEYSVKVSGVPAEEKLVRLRRGIFLDGSRTRPCEIRRVSTTKSAASGEGNAWLTVRLSEGRSRQIRRMFETIGHPVSKLKRVAIGPIRDDRLPVGAFRSLSAKEVEQLRKSLGTMKPPTLVAIDGPSGAGKSTVARALARRLGLPYIDTGAMYRAIGLAARERGIALPIADAEAVARLAETLRLDIDLAEGATRVRVDGRDVSQAIREPEISRYASAVSSIAGVRRRLVAEQQRLGRAGGGVMEGRDIGTRVFPEAPFKFFLTASAPVRAQRRALELAERGTPQPYEAVLAEMEKRDRDDSSRAESPLTLDDRYVVVDSTGRDAEEVVDELERRIRAAG